MQVDTRNVNDVKTQSAGTSWVQINCGLIRYADSNVNYSLTVTVFVNWMNCLCLFEEQIGQLLKKPESSNNVQITVVQHKYYVPLLLFSDSLTLGMLHLQLLTEQL